MMNRLEQILAGLAVLALPASAGASDCDDPSAAWLMCEDFEGGGAGWDAWFSQSPWVECNGCPDGTNDPARILLDNDGGNAHDGDWSLHMPADASAGYTGGALTFRNCADGQQAGCALEGHEQLFFRTWVRLAPDHQYVHHFLSIAGTQPNNYWDSDGNAGCRPNGYRAAGTTVDFNSDHELFFYTYFPGMNCDSGGYCSGQLVQDICDGCAQKDMPCDNGPECCWGNLFQPDPPVILPPGEWTCLEMMMELNTPGDSDGRMAFWVDDELALEQTGMSWRDVPELQLNKAWLQHYIAGGDADQSNRVWFDDAIVSTERIGCTASIPPDTDSAGSDDGGGDSAGDSAGDGGTSAGDGADSAGDGGSDGSAGDGSGGSADDGDAGCGCRSDPSHPASWLALLMLAIGTRARRSRPRHR